MGILAYNIDLNDVVMTELSKSGFVKLSEFDKELFRKYQKYVTFSDMVYSLLYAWEFMYSYMVKEVEQNIVITGIDINKNVFFSVICANEAALSDTVRYMKNILSNYCEKFSMKYITQSMKDILSKEYENIKYDAGYSDYIYTLEDFIDLKGKRNSSKRQEYKLISETVPNAVYKTLDRTGFEDMKYIFNKWCEAYDCSECVWGCEKKAFDKLLEVYNDKFLCGAIYIDNKPASFGTAEIVNDNFVTYHIQKNASRMNGLTYFLHYNMAMQHMNIPYINWGEDMGIEGIRLNKSKYKPCRKENKYEIEFNGGRK